LVGLKWNQLGQVDEVKAS